MQIHKSTIKNLKLIKLDFFHVKSAYYNHLVCVYGFTYHDQVSSQGEYFGCYNISFKKFMSDHSGR